MRILLALALAAAGDYRDWINTAKQPGYFNTADAPATFALFNIKARDAKAVSAANATSYDDFDPVSAENGFLLLDKFAKDAGSALRAPGVAINVVDALGAMTASDVLKKTKYGMMNMEKPTWNKMAAQKAHDVLDTVVQALMYGKHDGAAHELVTQDLEMILKRKQNADVVNVYLGKGGGGRFRLPTNMMLPDSLDVVVHTYKQGAGAWADGDGQVSVLSPVVGLSLRYLNGTKIVVAGLSSPISVRIPNTTSATRGACSWWKQEDATWSTVGCHRTVVAPNDGLGEECLCTHLTEFALVGDTLSQLTAPTSSQSTLSGGELAGIAVGSAAVTYAGVSYVA